MKGKYKTELLGAVHETAVGLHKVGVISEKEMREYDKDCLVQTPKAVHNSEHPTERENPAPAIA
jgi:DNA-binding transcriptional regulator YiaG